MFQMRNVSYVLMVGILGLIAIGVFGLTDSLMEL